MDTLAHGIWTAIAFSGQPRRTIAQAVVWSTAPDLIPFTAQVLLIPFNGFDRSAFLMVYPFTHSLVIFAAVFSITALVLRSIPYPMLAWPCLHILIDIPGHQRFLTPFLFPLSDYRVAGWWEWLSPQMLFLNYAVIATVLVIMGVRRRAARRARAEAESSTTSEAAR